MIVTYFHCYQRLFLDFSRKFIAPGFAVDNNFTQCFASEKLP